MKLLVGITIACEIMEITV